VPALRGSLTLTRLFVEGTPPRDLEKKSLKQIRLRALQPLEPDEEIVERAGWCVLGEPYDLDLTAEKVFAGDLVLLGLRSDRWSIPGSLIQGKLREAEQAARARQRGRQLSRKEKAELRDHVIRTLRRKLVPSTRAVDLVWSRESGIVRFFSQSPRTVAIAMELFQRTFELPLVPESPYTLAARLGLTSMEDPAWAALQAAELTPAAEGKT